MSTSLTLQQRLSASVLICALTLAACTGSSTPAPSSAGNEPTSEVLAVAPTTAVARAPRPEGPKTLNVPGDYKTIQAAVDASYPNDLVLVAPGVWNEEVIVRTPNIVIRGEDRNTVILDGKDELTNGIQVSANGVAIENLTVKRYQVNGVVFTNAYDADDPTKAEVLRGYRASYVTVANNGLYGLYAFFARGGQFDHVYGSGHPDGGIYIGQCKPCDALVTDALMEHNGIGYSGTNSSGNVFLVNSIYRKNRIGMTPNSQKMETLSPQGDVVMAGNLVEDNSATDAPPAASGAFGFGIAVGGGERNVIIRNRVRGNSAAGIAITTLDVFLPSANKVEGNELSNNGVDLAFYAANGSALAAAANCFATNTFTSSAPADIEKALPCSGAGEPAVTVNAAPFTQAGPPGVDYRKIALPGPQPQMPDALTAPAVPATPTPPTVDLTSIKVPA
jgi:Right handed beta helix region